MTALVDIRKALGSMPPVEEGKQRFIIVGRAAMYSLRTDTKDHVKPTYLANSNEHYAIIETDEFPGWTIVDKPVGRLRQRA